MHPRLVARADQIRAALREAERPLPVPELYRRLHPDGRSIQQSWNTWTVDETVKLLRYLYALDELDVARTACCGYHALWCLPADV